MVELKFKKKLYLFAVLKDIEKCAFTGAYISFSIKKTKTPTFLVEQLTLYKERSRRLIHITWLSYGCRMVDVVFNIFMLLLKYFCSDLMLVCCLYGRK